MHTKHTSSHIRYSGECLGNRNAQNSAVRRLLGYFGTKVDACHLTADGTVRNSCAILRVEGQVQLHATVPPHWHTFLRHILAWLTRQC